MSLASRPSHPADQSLAAFDYESKTWGAHEVRLAPTYLGAMRLKYCLEDLQDIRGKVLEVGCGAGGMARAIKAYRPDLEVYGCDVSRQALAAAQQNPRGVNFDYGDAYDLPYDPSSFSAVVMFDVLEHLEDPVATVAEIRRVLRTNGLYHLFVPCEGEPYTIHGLLRRIGWKSKEIYGGHIQQFRLSAVQELLRTGGFTPNRWRWSGHIMNQVIDAAYFTALSLIGRNTNTSVEGYLAAAQPSILTSGLGALKTFVATLSFYESVLTPWIPASGAHIGSHKSDEGEAAR
ncbi:MAG: class I SAM-dependent methyltransferase [Anaerolineales bacterium]